MEPRQNQRPFPRLAKCLRDGVGLNHENGFEPARYICRLDPTFADRDFGRAGVLVVQPAALCSTQVRRSWLNKKQAGLNCCRRVHLLTIHQVAALRTSKPLEACRCALQAAGHACSVLFCMPVCMHVCMCACIYVKKRQRQRLHVTACMTCMALYACMYVCMCACMYVKNANAGAERKKAWRLRKASHRGARTGARKLAEASLQQMEQQIQQQVEKAKPP